MIVSYRWLRRFVRELPAPDIVEQKLTQLGWEVVSRKPWGTCYEPVELVEIIKRVKHPHADRLSVMTIRRLNNQFTTVVSGAENGVPGDHVWYAPPGTQLTDGRVMETVNMRGIDSPGMLLSAEELGFKAGFQDLWIWDGDQEVGTGLLDVLGGRDTIFELELTPNLAVFGQNMRAVARELAAALSLPWDSPVLQFVYDHVPMAEVSDAHDCPIYGLSEFRIKPNTVTPLWMQVLLRSIGLRLIHPAVDLTNFVLWDLGQPLHAFDADKVDGKIEVRRAQDGEMLMTLDGIERKLSAQDLVIADQQKPLALAGVMGGSQAAVSFDTTRILLESAHFDSQQIFQTLRRHQVYSDAALHFGKGTDPQAVFTAAAYYQNMLEKSGMLEEKRASQIIGEIPPMRQILFYPQKIRHLLGVSWSDDKILDGLKRLGFLNDGENIVIPSDRHDVEGSHDLAEDVARLYGLEEISPRVFVTSATPGRPTPKVAYYELIRNSLAAAGYWEVITRSFTSSPRLRRAGVEPPPNVITVVNPLREEEMWLRPSLLPGMLEVVEANRGRRDTALSLFELSPVYVGNAEDHKEYQELTVIRTLEEHMRYPRPEAPHLLELKGVMEWMNQKCGMGLSWKQLPSGPEFMHPGRLLAVYGPDGAKVGYLGEMRPRIAQRYGAKRMAVWLMRILGEGTAPHFSHIRPPVRYPEVIRDLSLIVPQSVSYENIFEKARQLRTRILQSMEPVDDYQGDFGISWTFRLVFQSEEKTLTDQDVNDVIQQFLRLVEDLGVTIRQ
ncbi:MAG: phenylalanine--tRNA ligase subunit beta [Firmicutes bacterium]|nr:phenylalanine--tRNA ligase subunit beta [Bacillota bacterium]